MRRGWLLRRRHRGALVVGVTTHAPDQPTISAGTPTSSGVTLTGSAFSDSDVGDTHAASQWQVTTSGDTGYATPVISTGDDATNKTSYAASGLSASTGYIARVRYKDSAGNYSAYSTSASFTTAASVTVYGSDAFTDVDNTIAHSHTPVAVGAGPAFSSLVDINGANSVLKIINNRMSVVGAAIGSTYRIGWNTASAPPAAQTLTFDFVFLTDEGQQIAVGCNSDVPGGHVGGYYVQWQLGAFKLMRVDDSFGSTQLGSSYSYPFAAGTVPIILTHNGTGGLTVSINGVANAITATDATPLTGLRAAMYVRMTGTTTTLTSTTGIVPDNVVLKAP